jgi:DNA-binding NtrC family response regulator
MARLWIIHRDGGWRDALRRLAGDVDALATDPCDVAALEGEPPPRAILLGVSEDFEAELELAHRLAPRLAAATAPPWVLLAASRDLDEVRRLFDALPAEVIPITADAPELRRRVRAALARRPGAALTERRRRDALAARFARWLGDLDWPELLAALDPARRDEPLLVRGEPGTGRGLVARYVHWMSAAGAPGPFASVSASPSTDGRSLLSALVPETGELRAGALATVCIEDVDRLPRAAQRQLRGWIEHGPPAGALPASRVRWMATAGLETNGDGQLDPDLARALAGLEVRLPPLRERPDAIARVTAGLSAEWCAARGEQERDFAPDAIARLRAYAWPGNLRELEAVGRRTLAATRASPIGASDLRFDPAPPLAPELVAELIEVSPTPEALPAPPPRQGDRLEYPPQAPAGRAQRGEAERSPSGRAAAQHPIATAQQPTPPRPQPPAERDLRRLVGAVAHEVGSPLVGIRTFTQMLHGRFDDPEFRRQFTERVEADTRRIEAAVDTLERLGSLRTPELQPVDVSALLARLLQLQRGRIQDRRLVVLEELERERPLALADAEQLRFAFGLLFEQALTWIADRGDLYVATRHQAGVAGREARLRILLRFRGGPGAAEAGLSLADYALAVVAVESVVRAQGGSFSVESAEPGETLVLIELAAA